MSRSPTCLMPYFVSIFTGKVDFNQTIKCQWQKAGRKQRDPERVLLFSTYPCLTKFTLNYVEYCLWQLLITIKNSWWLVKNLGAGKRLGKESVTRCRKIRGKRMFTHKLTAVTWFRWSKSSAEYNVSLHW